MDGSTPPAPDLAAARAKLGEDGWCVVPHVLSKGEAAAALARLWDAEAASRRNGMPTFLPMLDPNEANVRVFYLMALDPLFRDLIQHPLAVDLVQSLLGPQFIISNFTANIARPGSQSMALHSDQSLVVPEPWLRPWAMNIIWCLTDVTFENGGTLFIPCSHRWTSHADIPADADRRLVPFEAKAGSIVAMEGRIWHTSGANITADQDRALLFGYYTAPFLRQQVNWNAALPVDVRAGLSPVMRHRLGLEVNANIGAPESDMRPLKQQYPRS
jgi:hypothetical protein